MVNKSSIDLGPEIQSVLEKTEKIIWSGKQDLASAMVKSIFAMILMIGVGVIISLVTGNPSGTCKINGVVRPAAECGKMASYFAYALIGIGILLPLGAYLQYRVTRYVITSKRVLLKSGLIGADMRSIYYDQIKSAFVDVGIIGKIFGTGTIKIDTGRITQTKNGSRTVYDRFDNIKTPYDVYKFLQDNLSSRKEGLHSGRSDFEGNKQKHKEYVQETERYRRSA